MEENTELSTWVDQSPQQTRDTVSRLTQQLVADLLTRAHAVMARRKSSTLTDSDVEEAFKEMTAPPKTLHAHSVSL